MGTYMRVACTIHGRDEKCVKTLAEKPDWNRHLARSRRWH